MTQNAHFVQRVQGLCRALCRVFHSCAGCAGSIAVSRACARRAKPTPHKRTHAHTYTLHTLHTLHTLDSYTYFHASPCTDACTPCTDTLAHAPNSFIHSFESKKMEETPKACAPAATRTIRCTPDNARDMQQMVKQWPELHALVQDLQAHDLFPGLRGLSVTLTGPQEFVAGGIGAINQLNAQKRD